MKNAILGLNKKKNYKKILIYVLCIYVKNINNKKINYSLEKILKILFLKFLLKK